MKYLDYNNHDRIAREYFGEDYSSRAVGTGRSYDSGYIDIFRFFGPMAVDPSNIAIKHDPRPFVFTDSVINVYSALIEDMMREEGRLYDGPLVMRLAAADMKSTAPSLTVQFATYGQQAGSCFALDYRHRLFDMHGGTLRRYWKSRYRSAEVVDNPLAICFGVCGFLITQERTILCQHRTRALASLESTVGPSAAGSVDWTDTYQSLAELVRDAMAREITEELGLRANEYDLIPLAYAREIFRGEKPQIFCAIKTPLSQEELLARMSALSPAHSEHDHSHFIPCPEEGRPAPAGLNFEAKMNYYLLEEWLSVR